MKGKSSVKTKRKDEIDFNMSEIDGSHLPLKQKEFGDFPIFTNRIDIDTKRIATGGYQENSNRVYRRKNN